MGISFFYGIQDAFTPLQFANFWMFTLILAYRGTSVKRIFWITTLYCFSLCFTYFSSVFGAFDPYFTDKIIVAGVRDVYVIFGLFFFSIGMVSIVDWYRINFTDTEKMILQIPKALIPDNNNAQESKQQTFNVYFVPFFVAWFMSFLSMIWEEEFIFNTFSYVISAKNIIFTLKIYFAYLSGQIFPFIAVGLTYCILLKIINYKDVALSAVKIIFSAVGIGLGVNLIILRFI